MIVVNMTKAKDIAHGIRRTLRAEEFKPLDDVIAKQIPGTDAQAVEAQRQLVRDKYAAMQVSIESAESAEALKATLPI